METRANYVVIGLFTLAVIAGGFGFVYWFSRAGDGGERAVYRVVFDGAVHDAAQRVEVVRDDEDGQS